MDGWMNNLRTEKSKLFNRAFGANRSLLGHSIFHCYHSSAFPDLTLQQVMKEHHENIAIIVSRALKRRQIK